MEPIALRVYEGITTHAWVRARAKQRDVRRDAGDTISGAEWSWGDPCWVIKTRLFEKRRDWYDERVIDPAPGAILHEHADPFSAHQRHGAAKKHSTRS